METKLRKIKSICGQYTLIYSGHVSNGIIKSNKGIEYTPDIKVGKNKAFYSTLHQVTGFSAWADGMDSRKFFTMRFADCKKGVRIKPYTGNTILTHYSAIFRVQN
jgi:hypothetical protein